MQKQKGFTIIELIVVIAIIAILAAIVLVNVTTYISKAKDARINSDMASIALGMGSCFAAGNGTTYVGCSNGTTGTTYVPGTLISDIDTNNGLTGTASRLIVEHAATYVVCAKLASSAAGVCVDHTGTTKAVAAYATSCTGDLLICP